MNTRISAKLAAIAVALMMNSMIFAGVAYLFDVQSSEHGSLISLAMQIVKVQRLI
jgi:hypothetical protein